MLKTDILAIGATFFSAGLAVGHEITVLESSISFASDFVPCMKAASVPSSCAVSSEGQKLYSLLSERGLVNEKGELHVFPLNSVCAELLSETHVILDTVVTGIEKYGDGYLVSAFNGEGRFEILASKVVDTTALDHTSSPEGLRLSESSPVKKYLCATLAGTPKKDLNKYTEKSGLTVIKGAVEDEYILRLELTPDTGYAKASELLADAWRKSSPTDDFFGMKLAAVASEFWYDFAEPLVKRRANCLLASSTSFGNPVSAFEGGIKCFSHI